MFHQQSVLGPLVQDMLNPLRQFFGLVLWADREQKQIGVADLELKLGPCIDRHPVTWKERVQKLNDRAPDVFIMMTLPRQSRKLRESVLFEMAEGLESVLQTTHLLIGHVPGPGVEFQNAVWSRIPRTSKT